MNFFRWQLPSLLVCCTFILASMLVPLSAHAETRVTCPTQPLRAAFDDRGFNYYKGKGFDLDLVRELSRRTGCPVQILEMPRARIFDGLEHGSVDLAMFAIQTPERDRYAWFAPYMVQKNYALIAGNVRDKFKTMKDFEADPKATLGAVRGFAYDAPYNALVTRLGAAGRITELDNSEQLFRMVIAGRVQAALSLPTVISMYGKTSVPELAGISGLDWIPESPAKPHCLMLSKKTISEAESKRWQGVILAMLKDGTVKKFIANYVEGEDLQRSLLK